MATRINPNASIRTGYDFEDIHVLKLCVEWLKDPELFTEIRIQYIPDAVAHRGFAIDDVVAFRKDGTQVFYQLKHSQNPETDAWDFTKLFSKGFEKWIESVQKLADAEIASKTFLLTNGLPARDVAECLTASELSFQAIESKQPDTARKLLTKYSLELLKEVFSHFHFVFGLPSSDELERTLRETLYFDLKATKAGVDALLLAIHREGSSRLPNVFTLKSIRELLLWDNPRPLNQAFEVPKDFELFDERQHEELITDLKNPHGGIRVVVGKPGCGKSTYLSKLHEVLNKSHGVVTIRHHYHLNPKDASHRDRLDSDRVREALRAEFKRQRKAIGKLALENTKDTPLREFIGITAEHFAKQGKAFVIIIDGLDHVIREGHNSLGLSEFLGELLYEQEGYWLVLGTQEMAVKAFPNLIHKLCPQERWIEIKGLSRSAVEDLVTKNVTGLRFPAFDNALPSVAKEFYIKTQGNPLHLRYVLQQLKVRNEVVNEEAVKSVIPYKDEIHEYYADLWRQLPPLSQTFAFAITTLDFKLQEEELFELAAYLTREPAAVPDAFQQIKHLIRVDLHGISVYHNSFSVFMLNQPELAQQKRLLYEQIRIWLKVSENEELKWSELPKIEYHLGNPDPILSINREWIVQSFLQCRDEAQISAHLSLAIDAAYKAGDYEKLVSFNILNDSFANRAYNLHEVLPKIWTLAFVTKRKHGPIKYPDFEKLTHFQLKEMLIALHDQGRINRIPDETAERFNDFLHDRDNEKDEVAESWLELLAHFDDEPAKRAFGFIKHFRDKRSAQSGYFLQHYLLRALARSNDTKVLAVLNAKLRGQERSLVLDALVFHELLAASRKWENQLATALQQGERSNYTNLYSFLRSGDVPEKLQLSAADDFPIKVDYGSSRSGEVLKVYMDNFFTGLFLCARGESAVVGVWISLTAGREWQVLLMAKLLQSAMLISECYSNAKRISITSLLAIFDNLPQLNFYEHRDLYDLQRGVLPDALKELFLVAIVHNINLGLSTSVDNQELTSLINSRWLSRRDVIELLNTKGLLLSKESYRLFKEHEVEKLESDIIPFRDRAERFADLATQARRNGHVDDADELLHKAADNIIAYGNHKDYFLYLLIQSIDECAKAGSRKTNEYIRRIAPYVYHIEDLTDGDETGNFIYDWANLLIKHDCNLLRNFYFHALAQRDYPLAEFLFADLLECTDFEQPVGFAIGSTAVDKTTYGTLEVLVEKDARAASALADVRSIFGPIDFTENRGNSDSDWRNNIKEDDTNYAGVAPAALKAHLAQLRDNGFSSIRYERQKYVERWAAYWLKERPAELEEVMSALRAHIEPAFEEASRELLDCLYPYALRFNRAFAFKCLVWAHANSHAWSSLFSVSSLEDAQQRWKLALEDFPERVEEFYHQSIHNTGKQYGKGGGHSLPIPKSIPFYADLGQLEKAESIFEHYLNALPQLFPSVRLPVPAFIKAERQIGDFEVLLKRLEWVSPLARERAAWHLAELLKKDATGEVHEQFLAWLKDARLETFACYGLLILLKSLEDVSSKTYAHLDVNGKSGDILSLRCMATDLLLSAIAEKLGQRLSISKPMIIAVSYGRRTISKKEFYDKISPHVPIIYAHYIDEIEGEFGQQVWHIWYALYSDRCEALGLVEAHRDKDYRNEARDFMKCRFTIFGEVLKSTFFRLLDYLEDDSIISSADFRRYTLKNLPVDVSLWNIKLSATPEWWPNTQRSSENPEDEDALARLELKPSSPSLLHTNADHQLLYLNGALIPPSGNHYEDTMQGVLHVLPFGYSPNYESLPDAETLFKALQQRNGFWYPSMPNSREFGIFQNEMRYSERVKSQKIVVAGTVITPLISQIILAASHPWQYYRLAYDFNLLAPILKGSSKLETTTRLRYNNNGQTVCEIHDFASGIRSSAAHDAIIPTGKYILIQKAYLEAILAQHTLKLGFVYSLEYRMRENSWSKEVKQSGSFGVIG